MNKAIPIALMLCASLVSAKEVHHKMITIVYVDDVKEIPITRQDTMEYGYQHGVAYVDNRTGVCTVMVVKPKDAEDKFRMEVLGHEIHHCVVGKYHD